ncbi:MAG: Stage III sporulation protein AF (Spore_III_AF) [Pelotomaculum sp. PtaU1.Bin035]|nr:MAG: Stage III sporulation protein AF (Spore_III_AF) [Pelotomaculum sp. PtaU1.Bin035]
MEVVRSLIHNLIVIVILAMLMEMLLPAGDMRKFVKMVMGLLIIVAVVQTVGDLLRRDYSGDLPYLTEKGSTAQLSGIMEAGKYISGEQQQKAIEQYKRGLANQIVALASINKEVPVIDAEIRIQSGRGGAGFGSINEIVLVIAKGPGRAEKRLDKGGIEPVTVEVDRQLEIEESVGNESVPPLEAVADLEKTVANFYNLKPEQVKCVYR